MGQQKVVFSYFSNSEDAHTTRPHWTEILERLMLKSEDDPIDIMFYFPVAFSQVRTSGDGSSRWLRNCVLAIALGWAAKERERDPGSPLVASPISGLPLLFSYSFHPFSEPPNPLFIISRPFKSWCLDPSSSFIRSSSLRSILFFQSFIFYLIITICCCLST